jgi:hypothetical protein
MTSVSTSEANVPVSQLLRQSLIARRDILRGHFLEDLERGEILILPDDEVEQIEGLKSLIYASDDRFSRFSQRYQEIMAARPYFELSTIVQNFFGGTLPEEWRHDAKPFDLATADDQSLRSCLRQLADEALKSSTSTHQKT